MAEKKKTDGKRRDSHGRLLHTGEGQRTNGTYCYRWSVDGKSHCIYAPTLAALRVKEKAVKRDRADGLSYTDGNKTLRALFDEYVDIKKHEWRPATYVNNVDMFNRMIGTEKIADMKICEIKPKHIQELYTQAASRGLRQSTLKFMSGLLRSAFSYAVLNDYIRRDPSAGVLSGMKLNTTPKIEKTPLTQKQVNALSAFCNGHPVYGKFLPFLVVAIETGCRVGELAALQWSDFDREKAELHISKGLVYKKTPETGYTFYLSAPKTEKGKRIIPLSDAAIKAFETIRKSQVENGIVCTLDVDGNSHFCFLNRNGQPYSPAAINNALENMRRAYNAHELSSAKIEHREPELLPHFSAHCLRHTNATLLAERNMAPKALQGTMGHAQYETTANVYSHGEKDLAWVKDQRRAAGDLVNF